MTMDDFVEYDMYIEERSICYSSFANVAFLPFVDIGYFCYKPFNYTMNCLFLYLLKNVNNKLLD